MNDPGLDGPIGQEAEKTENEYYSTDEKEEELLEEAAFLNQTRWWFASTAFPLLAGTFGPIANAFSICALVQSWRVIVPPGGTEEHGIKIQDPHWYGCVDLWMCGECY
jgi:potassium channel subfamily K, other eukaryote